MKLLAFDTSTEALSIAVQRGEDRFEYTGAGGAQASAQMIPQIEALMARAGLRYTELDAIVFGRGPGSFTGLRTACSVAQGLAFGAGVAVLPVDTLLAVAQEARRAQPEAHRILACLDARMGEVYSACYEFGSCSRTFYGAYHLKTPEKMADLAAFGGIPELLAGNIRPLMDAALPPSLLALPYLAALPTARSLLELAPSLIEAGQLVPPELALPLYVRDQVALTTAQREAAK